MYGGMAKFNESFQKKIATQNESPPSLIATAELIVIILAPKSTTWMVELSILQDQETFQLKILCNYLNLILSNATFT